MRSDGALSKRAEVSTEGPKHRMNTDLIMHLQSHRTPDWRHITTERHTSVHTITRRTLDGSQQLRARQFLARSRCPFAIGGGQLAVREDKQAVARRRGRRRLRR
eukprot:3582135-Prymnesium_polylepis.1